MKKTLTASLLAFGARVAAHASNGVIHAIDTVVMPR